LLTFSLAPEFLLDFQCVDNDDDDDDDDGDDVQ
jgi:hypothetical protein